MKSIIFASLIATLPFAAAAQGQNCGERERVAEHLATGYGETRVGAGLGGNTLVEIWANVETGSWTITVTTPAGVTCLVASGSDYQVIAEALPNTDDPA